MVRPEELTKNEPLLWCAGNGTEVWDLFCACAAGDLETVERLVGGNPSLVRAHYEYRTPLYLAVRENRIAVARFLLDCGANPFYNGEDLIEMASLRRLADMEALIESQRPKSQRPLSVFQTVAQAVRSGNVAAARQVMDGLQYGLAIRSLVSTSRRDRYRTVAGGARFLRRLRYRESGIGGRPVARRGS